MFPQDAIGRRETSKHASVSVSCGRKTFAVLCGNKSLKAAGILILKYSKQNNKYT